MDKAFIVSTWCFQSVQCWTWQGLKQLSVFINFLAEVVFTCGLDLFINFINWGDMVRNLRIWNLSVMYLIEVVTTEEEHDSFWGDEYISYTIQGKFLTISCLVRGSENTTFRWFKDGMLIDMSMATRQGYQTVINSRLDGTIRSVLYYGSVTAFDRGKLPQWQWQGRQK